MKQPSKIDSVKITKKRKKSKPNTCNNISGLETFFENEILVNLNIKYSPQYHISNIGRFYDFYLPDYNLLIEVDGDYWHYNPIINKNKKPNKIQAKNIKVDKIKNSYAFKMKFNMIRIWETDINKKTDLVLLELRNILNFIEKMDKKDRPIQKTLIFD